MTTTYAPVPLHHLPRGLTVVPAGHRGEFTAAYAAFRDLVTRHLTVDAAIEETALAAIWGDLYRRHIRPLHQQVDAAQAHARETRLQMSAYEAELRDRREAEACAATKRALSAERRDRALREQVRGRDGDQCRYCGTDVCLGGRGGGVLDHIVPGVAAGVDNLVTACRPCRRRKRTRTPQDAGMSLRLPPTPPRITAPSEPPKREEPMDRTTIDKTHVWSGGTPPPEGDTAAAGRVPQVRLTVTYPGGSVATVSWTAADEEPTPDELAEMIKTLMPAVDPVEISLDRPAEASSLGEDLDRLLTSLMPQIPMLPWSDVDRHGSQVSVSEASDGVRLTAYGTAEPVVGWDQAVQAALAVLVSARSRSTLEQWKRPSSELEKL